MADEEEEKPFAVERAKSARAKCKKCKCPIDKDTVRIAKLVANPFSEGKMKAWHHPTCLFEVFAKQRASTKRIDDPEEDISGWQDLCEEDKKVILEMIEAFEKSAPYNTAKAKSPGAATKPSARLNAGGNLGESASPRKPSGATKQKGSNVDPVPSTSTMREPNVVVPRVEKNEWKISEPSKDDLFRAFRRVCAQVAEVDAYTDKTAIVGKFLSKGTNGDGFRSDVVLWCKLLLPGVVQRMYNLRSKQLIKLFARLLRQDEDAMLEDLEQGDVAETIRIFFESSDAVKPAQKSELTVQEVDEFLEKLSRLTKEDEQIEHFRSIVGRCTGNDLKMIIRLIKHDLRINAGAKHILSAIDKDAYEMFQASRDLEAVVKRCTSGKLGSKGPVGAESKVALSLMTPVLPMLAQACKSVEMAMKKCPDGMLSEVKYDGERVQVHKRGDEFRYFSRSLKPVLAHKVNLFKDYIPKAFPDGDDLILDSEVLLIDTNTGQPLPFGSLGVHKKSEFKGANVCLFVFDCIYYNGQSLMHKTTLERRRILKEIMTEIPNRIMLSEVREVQDPQDLAEMIAKVLRTGLEGLVLKDVNSKYEPGKRHWLKIKKDYLCDGAMADTADLVVLGAWYGTGNKGGMMSIFLMGCYDEERDVWLTVTKVHTGHDDETLKRLQSELDMVKIGKDPGKVPCWLRVNRPMVPDFVARDPKMQPVWEITGAEFTNQGVHTAEGISIRFPRVTRIRHDKDWATATSLSQLREIFKRSSESIDFSLILNSPRKKEPGVASRLDAFLKKDLREDDDDAAANTPCKRKRSDEAKMEMVDGVKMEIKTEPDRPKTSLVKRFAFEQPTPSSSKVKIEPGDWDETDESTSDPGVGTKIEPKDSVQREDNNGDAEKRAEFYSFVGNHYIEYSARGSPLNWIEGRKPARGLPTDARPLSRRTDDELKARCVLKDVRASLSRHFDRSKRRAVRRTLKTLGATLLKEEDKSRATHVIHTVKEIPSTSLQEFDDVPRTARHVNVSWVDATACASEMAEACEHAVQLAPDYCDCPCQHR